MKAAKTLEMSPEARRAGLIWGGGVVVVMISFMIFISVNVARMLCQQPELVRKDYYVADLAFQKTLDARARAEALGAAAPQILNQHGRISLSVKPGTALNGKAQLQRPSDAKLDRQVKLAAATDGSQVLADSLAPGRWILTLSWINDGKDFEKIWNLSVVP